jgi:hypothetical protein
LLSAITEFLLPANNGLAPTELTVGPDGNLWFAENAGPYGTPGVIGRITPSGALTAFPLPANNGVVVPTGGLTVGPDANLWFLANASGASGETGVIGRITPSGALTEFPLSANTGFPSGGLLTVGPDGNLWFPEQFPYAGPGAVTGAVGRITPSGALTEIPINDVPGDLTVGPDGNLWFPATSEGPGSAISEIGRITPPPRVTGVVAVTHSRKGITSIILGFDEALDPGTAGTRRFYSLATGVKRHHKLVFRRGVKIGSVSYDGTAHAVTLKLTKPHKGLIQVTVRAGIVAVDGVSSVGEFTAVVR